MADRGDTHYFGPHLNLWFAASGILFLGSILWMVIDDWNAGWKHYQREFRELDLTKTNEALAALETDAVKATEAELQAAIEAAEESLDGQSRALNEAKEKAYALKETAYEVEQAFKGEKGVLGWDRWVEEESNLAGDGLNIEKLDGITKRMEEYALELENAREAAATAAAEVSALTAGVDGAAKDLKGATRDLELLRAKREQLDPSRMDEKAANILRDFPGIDFVGPRNKVDKIVLDDLTFELNFTKKKRIDMCKTCHQGVEREGFEDAVQPYTTHPRLDLFLSAKSPHPYNKVGCTICHRGSGESLSFQHVDHRPNSEAQADEWGDEYHWHKQHHWDYPMLPEKFTEASCVQCHTTTMEVIAEDAPKLTEGYQMFERFGCYACHKVEWFPTKRRPGPSLANMADKLEPDFVEAWITDPKEFRPTTWMPQVFHLENYAPDEIIAHSKYGEGRPILGQEWNVAAVSAITSFIFDNSGTQDATQEAPEGDAHQGRELFRVKGCLACHNLAPYDGDTEGVRDLAFEKSGENEHGPNLRGVATKINAGWLFRWLKDPASYWHETNMPNLRLSDQDAADITSYMMEDPDGYFTEVPEGWSPGRTDPDLEAMQEIARWYIGKLSRKQMEARLSGQDPEHRWDDKATLSKVVGQQLVTQYGCYSCHEIRGMEDMMPIGAELTNWASKTVDKLDFGMHYRMEVAGLPKLDHYYNDGWLERKLSRPRSYDLEKVKNPKEKLRMPWFDFTDDQTESIATFVLGLVEDEVQRAKMVPTSEELSMDMGQRALRQKNCMACHNVEPSRVTFFDEDGELRTVDAELLAFEDEVLPPPMSSRAELADYIDRYEWDVLNGFEEDPLDLTKAELEELKGDMEHMEEIGFRLLQVAPTLGIPMESVFIEPSQLVDVHPGQGGDFVRVMTNYLFYGTELHDSETGEYFSVQGHADDWGVRDTDGQFRDYSSEPYDKVRWTFAPPVLWNEGAKVQKDWFFRFLNDPVTIRRQMNVVMPSFTWNEGEAAGIANYFAAKSAEEYPARYTRALRYALGSGANGSSPWIWPQSIPLETEEGAGITTQQLADVMGQLDKAFLIKAETIEQIEAGYAPTIAANFEARVKAFGDRVQFVMNGPPSTSYEVIEERTPSYLAQHPEALAFGHALAGAGGVNCWQCHFRTESGTLLGPEESPIGWAPVLDFARERLRPEWVEAWIINPALIYPGTAMPQQFISDPPAYQEAYPGSTNSEQIQTIVDWLFNLERATDAAAGE